MAYFEKEENGFPVVFLPHKHADNLMKLSPIVFQDKGLVFFRKKATGDVSGIFTQIFYDEV